MTIEEKELRASLANYRIPEHMHDGVIRYIVHGISPGHFLSALCSNDLMGAFGRADQENIDAMASWVKWLYNEAPSNCWGSPAMVAAYIADKRAMLVAQNGEGK